MAPRRGVVVGICAALVAITWLIFGQTLGHQFVSFDDPQYVYGNRDVAAGLSLGGIAWSFSHTIASNWHPITIISHMLDCQLYGLNASGHHFTNVLLHTIAVILLFLALQQMTGSLWRSGFVAALFAIHPLHVESVAWISERKDVLSAVFFMLTLGAYIRYVRALSLAAYLLVLLMFALGLMSKPMLVTLPFVLLLLDYWPLSRIRAPGFAKGERETGMIRSQWPIISRLITEKIPLFALVCCFVRTDLATHLQSAGSKYQLPFTWRFNNAVVSYVAYIWQMFWPVRLAAFYPHPNDQLALWQVLLAIAFLIAITLLAIHWRKEQPYSFHRLVLVCGNACSGDWARAGRRTSARGSVYLPAANRFVCRYRLGHYRPDTVYNASLNATEAAGTRCSAPRSSAMIVILIELACVCTNIVLERQRGALEPRAGCHQ